MNAKPSGRKKYAGRKTYYKTYENQFLKISLLQIAIAVEIINWDLKSCATS
jgi:hypothetical protein